MAYAQRCRPRGTPARGGRPRLRRVPRQAGRASGCSCPSAPRCAATRARCAAASAFAATATKSKAVEKWKILQWLRLKAMAHRPARRRRLPNPAPAGFRHGTIAREDEVLRRSGRTTDPRPAADQHRPRRGPPAAFPRCVLRRQERSSRSARSPATRPAGCARAARTGCCTRSSTIPSTRRSPGEHQLAGLTAKVHRPRGRGRRAVLPTLEAYGPFDLVFIDADKAGYGDVRALGREKPAARRPRHLRQRLSVRQPAPTTSGRPDDAPGSPPMRAALRLLADEAVLLVRDDPDRRGHGRRRPALTMPSRRAKAPRESRRPSEPAKSTPTPAGT